jgi:hypothetical protein
MAGSVAGCMHGYFGAANIRTFYERNEKYIQHYSEMWKEKTNFISRSKWRELKIKYVRFEVFTPVTMKSGVLWDVTPCGSSSQRVSANVVPSSPIMSP